MHPAICPEQRLPVKKLHAIALGPEARLYLNMNREVKSAETASLPGTILDRSNYINFLLLLEGPVT